MKFRGKSTAAVVLTDNEPVQYLKKNISEVTV